VFENKVFMKYVWTEEEEEEEEEGWIRWGVWYITWRGISFYRTYDSQWNL